MSQNEEHMEAEVQNQTEPCYAGFWLRVLASVIDTILMMLLFVPLFLAIFGIEYFTMPESRDEFDPVALLLNHVLPAVIIVALWIRFSGTPGKLLLGASLVDKTSLQPISAKQAIIRYLGYIPSFLVLGLGFIWVAFDKQKRGWHDMIAGTLVVRR